MRSDHPHSWDTREHRASYTLTQLDAAAELQSGNFSTPVRRFHKEEGYNHYFLRIEGGGIPDTGFEYSFPAEVGKIYVHWLMSKPGVASYTYIATLAEYDDLDAVLTAYLYTRHEKAMLDRAYRKLEEEQNRNNRPRRWRRKSI